MDNNESIMFGLDFRSNRWVAPKRYFFDLPKDILLGVLMEWVSSAKSISCLDIACSDYYSRLELFRILADPLFSIKVKDRNDWRLGYNNFVFWLSMRQVRIKRLCVGFPELHMIAPFFHQIIRLHGVEEVHVIVFMSKSGFKYADREVARFLKCCPDLTSFVLSCNTGWSHYADAEREVHESMDRMLLELYGLQRKRPRLKRLKMNFDAENGDTVTKLACDMNKTVEALFAPRIVFTEGQLQSVINACKKLRILHLGGQFISAERFAQFCFDGKSLTCVAINAEYVGDDHLMLIAEKMPKLHQFLACNWTQTTAKSLQHFTKHCRQLLQFVTADFAHIVNDQEASFQEKYGQFDVDECIVDIPDGIQLPKTSWIMWYTAISTPCDMATAISSLIRPVAFLSMHGTASPFETHDWQALGAQCSSSLQTVFCQAPCQPLEDNFSCFLKQCNALDVLRIDDCRRLSDAFILQIAAAPVAAMLCNLTLQHAISITDHAMSQLLRRCSQLVELVVQGSVRFSNTAFVTAILCCPLLEKANWAETAVTGHHVYHASRIYKHTVKITASEGVVSQYNALVRQLGLPH